MLSCTCTPRAYMMDSLRMDGCAGVTVALGFHPWEATGDDEVKLLEFEALAKDERFIGEVGLDFSSRYAATASAQVNVFERVARACSLPLESSKKRVLSVHAVHATDEVLDVLERFELTRNCYVVMHSFGGTHQQLLRAVQSGCWFSVGPRMLASKKGRAYVRSIPAERLLLETDLPSKAGEDLSASAHCEALEALLAILACELKEDQAELSNRIAANAALLFDESS